MYYHYQQQLSQHSVSEHSKLATALGTSLLVNYIVLPKYAMTISSVSVTNMCIKHATTWQ